MPLETVFLDAGGVLIYPNWWRVSDALAKHGVDVSPEALNAADPRARRELDDLKVIGGTTDASRGWLFFDLVLAHAGDRALRRRRPRRSPSCTPITAPATSGNTCRPQVVPALEALRARGLRLVVVSNANGTLLRAHGSARPDGTLRRRSSTPRTKASRSRTRASSRSRWQRSGARKETTIHVGDLYYVDVIGARNAGLRGVLLDEADLRPDADCPRLQSLAALDGDIAAGRFD